jgi:ribose/xylose/arabinose/galactoside ABC-type transport system permease subunit
MVAAGNIPYSAKIPYPMIMLVTLSLLFGLITPAHESWASTSTRLGSTKPPTARRGRRGQDSRTLVFTITGILSVFAAGCTHPG